VAARLRRGRHSLLGPGDRKRRKTARELVGAALRADKLILVSLAQDKLFEFLVADVATEFTNWHN
jgi:hypothetical protein